MKIELGIIMKSTVEIVNYVVCFDKGNVSLSCKLSYLFLFE